MMKLFLENPDKRFFVRELTRLTDCLINSVRRELATLEEIGFLAAEEAIEEEHVHVEYIPGAVVQPVDNIKGLNKKKYYHLNTKNLLYREFEALFNKGRLLMEKKFTDQMYKTGTIRYLGLSGFFVGNNSAKTDLLIIGDKLHKEKMQDIIRQFEQQLGHDIKYTLMDVREYRLRKDIADRFLNDILTDERNIVLTDDLKIVETL